jgi:PAS domain S-box-containing protein
VGKRGNGLPDEIWVLEEIVRKAEKNGTPDEDFSGKNENALCKALLWNMEQAVSMFRLLFDDSGKAVDFICEKVNPAFRNVTGIPPERILGKKGSDLFRGKIPYFDIFVRAAETGRKIRFTSYYPEIGKYFDMWAFSPEWGRFALLFTDTTDSVLAEKEHRLDQRFLGEILDSMNIWLMVFDERWNVNLWNRSAELLSGYRTEEVMSPGSPVLEKLFPEPAYRKSVLEEMKQAAEHSGRDICGEIQTQVALSGGGTRMIAWTCSRWKSDGADESGIIAAGRPVEKQEAP